MDDITERTRRDHGARIAFTFSIAEGIAFRLHLDAGIKLVAGRWSDIHPAVGVLAVLFVIKYLVIPVTSEIRQLTRKFVSRTMVATTIVP